MSMPSRRSSRPGFVLLSATLKVPHRAFGVASFFFSCFFLGGGGDPGSVVFDHERVIHFWREQLPYS